MCSMVGAGALALRGPKQHLTLSCASAILFASMQSALLAIFHGLGTRPAHRDGFQIEATLMQFAGSTDPLRATLWMVAAMPGGNRPGGIQWYSMT